MLALVLRAAYVRMIPFDSTTFYQLHTQIYTEVELVKVWTEVCQISSSVSMSHERLLLNYHMFCGAAEQLYTSNETRINRNCDLRGNPKP
jgi:hypothetical protein